MDVLPTSLLCLCREIFAPLIVRLANLSFSLGTFPQDFKTAHVLPLLKQPGLPQSDPASYRPISNLSTISKILERLALACLRPHLLNSKNFCPLQSAYRAGHSTETAFAKILDDIYSGIDQHNVKALVSLDISAAFDMVNHRILLKRLTNDFGISKLALSWQSYLDNRSQFVKLGTCSSPLTTCYCGALEGDRIPSLNRHYY